MPENILENRNLDNFQDCSESRIADALAEDSLGIYFDSEKQDFLCFNPKTFTWKIITPREEVCIVESYIKSSPEFRSEDTTTDDFYKKVIKRLQYRVAANPQPRVGIMLQDSFLNYVDNRVEKREPTFFCRTYLGQPYDPTIKLDKKAKGFLNNLCNHDPFQLQLLRHFLKNTLLGLNPAQTSIFLLGPSLTGKSTWTAWLQHLMEGESVSCDLQSLSRRFDAHSLIGQKVIFFHDVDHQALTGKTLSTFKNITAGDLIGFKDKFGRVGTYAFKGNIWIHGNNFFEKSGRSNIDVTGITRRILVFPCLTVSDNLDSNMLSCLKKNTLALVQWALTSPLPPNFLLGKVDSINRVLQSEEEDGLRAFIFSQVSYKKGARTVLGASEDPPENSLFWHYQRFCLKAGFEKPDRYRFGEKITSLLQSLHVDAELKRFTQGSGAPFFFKARNVCEKNSDRP